MGVTVTGRASVDVEPDSAIAELGVDVRADDVAGALQSASAGLGRLRAALIDRGVEPADLRTGQTSIWHQERTDDRGALTGTAVHATFGLRATLRSIVAAGEIVTHALTRAGADAQLNSLTFAVSDVGEALAQARRTAFADAREIASGYAAQAGRELGAVTAIGEPSGWSAGPPMRQAIRGEAVESTLTIPVDPGQQQVEASVTVTWAFAD